jgi:DNA-binding NtrC family response regulator
MNESLISARILVADDDTQMQLALKSSLSRAGYEVTVAPDGKQALEKAEEGSFDLIISDQRMPEMTGQELLAALQARGTKIPFIMITAHGTINQAVEAMQLGAADFIAKPFSADDLERVVSRVLSIDATQVEPQKKNKKGRAIITNDPFMIRVLEVAEAVARSDATVLIQGESGTGKELIARLIHSSSQRSAQPFVAVNCAALPATLLESELFGHEKGAFTGAQQRKIGKFELAHGGTILLDEISEMELVLQAKLLRVLQEREVDRVGGKDPISIDVRVLATTNRNLEEAVNAGKFRADLFYRLNVIPVTMPPLRERRGDIKLLVEHFMRHYLGSKSQVISDQVMRELDGYNWPGNVRELQNAVERAAILSAGAAPSAGDFLISQGQGKKTLAQQIEVIVNDNPDAQAETPAEEILTIRSGLTVQEMEKALIFETLKSTNYNRSNAAKLLGISVRTLRNKLHEYKADNLPGEE